MTQTFRDICLVGVEDDGVVFDPNSVTASRIEEAAQYEGVRVQLRGMLGTAMLNVPVDSGFGDAITPGPVAAEFPVVLDAPTPKLRAYPRDTVVAEKLEAMVQLGIANSRMKDFCLERIGAADHALTLAAVVTEIDAFVSPPLDAIRNETLFQRTWAQGRWR